MDIIPLGDHQRAFVHAYGERKRFWAKDQNYLQSIPNGIPCHLNLAAGDRGKLVKYLHAYHPTLQEQLLCAPSAWISPGE
jgi:hypothetical protein